MSEIVLESEIEEDVLDHDTPDALIERLSDLGLAAELLRAVVEQETALARSGSLSAFGDVIRAKRDALANFNQVVAQAQNFQLKPTPLDHDALRALIASTEENALVLDAVRNSIEDLSNRLRQALTSAADPGTYSPKGRGPRHAMAAQFDTKI